MSYSKRKKHNRTAKPTAPALVKTPAPILELCAMLEYMRPARSFTVDAFIDDFIAPLGGYTDEAGNHIVQVGDAPSVLWSCHTDTVHKDAGFHRLSITGDLIKTSKNGDASCLGADCTTGVWIMRDMIRHGVGGLYVFHADEEIGGHGSAFIAKHTPELLQGINHAIAFDRRGTGSIITHQGGMRCASDAFARSIAPYLPKGFNIDTGGTFTDTANYTDLVPECTNLSVGYEGAHTSSETQSISHALALREAMLKFDATDLVVERVAGAVEYDDYDARYWASRFYGSHGAWDNESMFDFVFDNTETVADFLEYNLGYSVAELRDLIEQNPTRRLTKGM